MKLFIVYLMLALASSVMVSSFATMPVGWPMRITGQLQNSGGSNKGRNLYRKKRRKRMRGKKGTRQNTNMQKENARLRREVDTLLSVLETRGYGGVRGGTTLSFDDSPFSY